MSIIVKTSFEKAKQYRGKGVVIQSGSRKNVVYFKVIIDDLTIKEALETKDSNIIMYEYEGTSTNETYLGLTETDLYISKSKEFGNDISEQDIIDLLEETPSGVVPIIKVPEDFKNFEFVCRMCDKYPRIRFCGGVLFCAEGCRLGCCGRDVLENAGVKFKDETYIKDGCSCSLDVISDEGVEFTVIERKVMQTKKTQKAQSSSTPKKQKTKMFGNLLGGFSVEL